MFTILRLQGHQYPRDKFVRRLLCSVVLVAAACGGDADDNDESSSEVVGASAHPRIPLLDMEDVVTFSDALVLFTVAGERELEPSAEDLQAGEGEIDRTLTLSIQRTLWRRPGAPVMPPTVEHTTPGWLFEGDSRRPFTIGAAPRLEVGQSYVSTFGRYSTGEWVPGDPGTQLAVQRGRLVVDDHNRGLFARTFGDRRSVEEVGEALRATRPDPAVSRTGDAGAEQRYDATNPPADDGG